jgi:uncharacterized protein YndB with AHSA1/START domain
MTAEEAADLSLEVEVRVEAAPEAVFPYFIDSERYARWQGSHADLDPRPGGRYRVEMEDGSVAAGKYVEVDPPRRVVFTWGWEGNEEMPPGSSTVEITLDPEGDATLVRVRHSGLPSEEWRRVHGEGWEMYLGRLMGAVGSP